MHGVNENQYQLCLETSIMLLTQRKYESFFNRNVIVIYNKKWIHNDSRKRSSKCLDNDEPPQFSRKGKIHQRKLMTYVWWSVTGVVDYDFIKKSSIKVKVYRSKLLQMMQKHRKKMLTTSIQLTESA